jgi:hypothetical protein
MGILLEEVQKRRKFLEYQLWKSGLDKENLNKLSLSELERLYISHRCQQVRSVKQ